MPAESRRQPREHPGRVLPFPTPDARTRASQGRAAGTRRAGRLPDRGTRRRWTGEGRGGGRVAARSRPRGRLTGAWEQRLESGVPRRRRRVLRGLVLLALVGMAVVLVLAAWDVKDLLPRYQAVPVRQGEVELALTTEALLIRDEWVQVSPTDGPLTHLVPEGRVVRVGTPVAQVGSRTLTAEHPGIVSYQVDGLEAELAPRALGWLPPSTTEFGDGPGPDWLHALPQQQVPPPGETVRAGQPVFKVVDSARLWIALTGEARSLLSVRTDDLTRVQFPALGDRSYRFSVAYSSPPETEETLLILAAADPFPDTLLFLRRVPTRVILGRWQGWVVPREALTVVEGQAGVRVRSSTGERLVPVSILGQGQEEAAVEGELHPGDQVLIPQQPESISWLSSQLQ